MTLSILRAELDKKKYPGSPSIKSGHHTGSLFTLDQRQHFSRLFYCIYAALVLICMRISWITPLLFTFWINWFKWLGADANSVGVWAGDCSNGSTQDCSSASWSHLWVVMFINDKEIPLQPAVQSVHVWLCVTASGLRNTFNYCMVKLHVSQDAKDHSWFLHCQTFSKYDPAA